MLPTLVSLRFGVWSCYGDDSASDVYNTVEFLSLCRLERNNLDLPSLKTLSALAYAFYMFLHFSVDCRNDEMDERKVSLV